MYIRTKEALVILSAAKDQLPVFGSPYCCTGVPLTGIILYVEDSRLPTWSFAALRMTEGEHRMTEGAKADEGNTG